jgi:hypothetical protein
MPDTYVMKSMGQISARTINIHLLKMSIFMIILIFKIIQIHKHLLMITLSRSNARQILLLKTD